jgi:hypothetical protein
MGRDRFKEAAAELKKHATTWLRNKQGIHDAAISGATGEDIYSENVAKASTDRWVEPASK